MQKYQPDGSYELYLARASPRAPCGAVACARACQAVRRQRGQRSGGGSGARHAGSAKAHPGVAAPAGGAAAGRSRREAAHDAKRAADATIQRSDAKATKRHSIGRASDVARCTRQMISNTRMVGNTCHVQCDDAPRRWREGPSTGATGRRRSTREGKTSLTASSSLGIERHRKGLLGAETSRAVDSGSSCVSEVPLQGVVGIHYKDELLGVTLRRELPESGDEGLPDLGPLRLRADAQCHPRAGAAAARGRMGRHEAGVAKEGHCLFGLERDCPLHRWPPTLPQSTSPD
mmetsp:Transcript_65545/g.213433  ORF Transcript_65545/g.213433 Transcript_65545/m.213433 type:complete len:289 (-) Transcript_65545:50-916(-)